MDNEEFQRRFDDVEKHSYEFDIEIADAYREINAENNLTTTQSAILESEFVAFRFMTIFEPGDTDTRRFRPLVEYTNGESFPSSKDVNQARLNYWFKRAGEVKNPIMKARYLDLTYEMNSKVSRKNIIGDLVNSYITASNVDSTGREIETIDFVARAFLVAYENKKKFPKLLIEAKKNVIEFIQKLSQDNPRWCLELMELTIEYHNAFKNEQLLIVKTFAEKGVEYYRNEKASFMILENYLKVDQQITEIVTPDKYNKETATRDNAQLYIDEADAQTDSLFIQQAQLLTAEKILRDGGLNREANIVHERIEKIAKEPSFEAAFKELSVEQTIPIYEINKLKEGFAKAEDKAALIAYAPSYMPSWKRSKKSGREEKYTSISDLVKSITYNEDNMPIAKAPDNEKNRKTMRHYDASMQVSSALLMIAIEPALNDGTFTMQDIEPQLEKVKNFNPDTYVSVVHGFKYFFDGNYYEALSILLPQLEDLMADVMTRLGMGRYRQYGEDIVEYKTLGPILSALRKQYGDDAYYFLRYKLVDPGKDNLRNINGHGKLKMTTPNLDRKAVAVLQAYMCILVPLKPIEPGDDKKESKTI